MTLFVNHSTPADGTFSGTGATAWNAAHSLSGIADVSQGGTGASSLTANYGLFGNGTSAVDADPGFTRTGNNGRYLFGGATDDGTSKLQVKGDAKFTNGSGTTYTKVSGSSISGTGGLTFDASPTPGALLIFLSGSGDATHNGGDVQINAGSAVDAGKSGGGFNAVAGDGTGIGGVGGGVFFVAGAGTATSGTHQFTDGNYTNFMTYDPANDLLTAGNIQALSGFKSSDGTAGITFAASPIVTLTVKNGLVVAKT